MAPRNLLFILTDSALRPPSVNRNAHVYLEAASPALIGWAILAQVSRGSRLNPRQYLCLTEFVFGLQEIGDLFDVEILESFAFGIA